MTLKSSKCSKNSEIPEIRKLFSNEIFQVYQLLIENLFFEKSETTSSKVLKTQGTFLFTNCRSQSLWCESIFSEIFLISINFFCCKELKIFKVFHCLKATLCQFTVNPTSEATNERESSCGIG